MTLCLASGAFSGDLGAPLAALPDYQPQQQVAGVLRSRGNEHMGSLMERWQRGFARYQPKLQFSDALTGTGSGIYGLEMRTAEIALMGRAIHPYERYGTYERSWVYPVEIEVATGSVSEPHYSPAFAIFVHRSNPLASLTLAQLDGIFGAQRGGGWHELSWDQSAARSADANLRLWNQLGLRGRLANQSIHVYGPPLQGAGAVTFFQSRVLHGGAMWNEDLREYADRSQMLRALAHDPAGIAYAPLGAADAATLAQLRVVPLAEIAGAPALTPTTSSVASRGYPLARPVYIDFTIDNLHSDIASTRVDPRVREFVRYILSRQGQQDVQDDGHFLPLPAAVLEQQLRRLDSQEPPPERELLE